MRANIKDIGYALCAHLEGQDVIRDQENAARIEVAELEREDTLILCLENGQRFRLKIAEAAQ
ncbi:hypothetical protein WOB59_00380 [Methylocystis sp. IM4]|jgi:hypothetical protein|uniref:hypothetical protein n=1 Tax=Methylocystis sp. IM4 TaxID=3136560 RepID=UPI0031199D54